MWRFVASLHHFKLQHHPRVKWIDEMIMNKEAHKGHHRISKISDGMLALKGAKFHSCKLDCSI